MEKGTVRLPMSGKAAYLRVQSGADSYLSPLKDWNGRVGLWSFDVETLPYWWPEPCHHGGEQGVHVFGQESVPSGGDNAFERDHAYLAG